MHIKLVRYIDINISIFIFSLIAYHFCYSNNREAAENVFKKVEKLSNHWETHIKSVKTYKTGFELTQPIIELNTDETITFEFDDLAETIEQYEYTVIHCDYNWNPTNMVFMEYAEGFEFNPIYDYRYSLGTLVQYRHYTLTIPNSNLKLKVSGNYILRVVKQGNRQEVVLQKQFRVYEPIVKIETSVRQPIEPQIQRTHQQMELTVNTAQLGKVDPNTDVVARINQNNQPYNELILRMPQYIDGSSLIYHTSTSPVFEGGNEFRQLNLKSFHYQVAEIKGIQQYNGVYHTILTPDKRVKTYRYNERIDINGKFIVKCDDVTESQVEADYTWVYFTLGNDVQFDGDIYIFGELSGWELNPNFKLKFNPECNCYETRLLLKQGFYNYKYVFVSHGSTPPDFNRIEANFFETENSYNILVYYKSQGVRHWRLVGINTVNSRYKN
ncbi:MAG TPA: DUF5103 domain-containing protein [Bacteroidales bacterium]|nr:DUF5103 domain-containing protein [Bacteroidales bacterium]